MSVTADWIAVDWGTSNLRAWAMTSSGTVLDDRRSDRGMGQLSPAEFEPVLTDLVEGWTRGPTDVVACGMVGSRQGWAEAAYATVPCAAAAGRMVEAPSSGDLRVRILPGVKQDNPADVMRGEETQIAGFLALNPGWDGVLCLPGTHTKWVEVSAGEIVSFQTYMTGELYAALAQHTVLRHSIAPGEGGAGFAEAVAEGMTKPQKLAARFFGLRAEDLLAGLSGPDAAARLSGLLIGAELAGAKPYWLGRQIAVIGTGKVTQRYVEALAAQGVPSTHADGDRMTLAGLSAAWRQMKEPAT